MKKVSELTEEQSKYNELYSQVCEMSDRFEEHDDWRNSFMGAFMEYQKEIPLNIRRDFPRNDELEKNFRDASETIML
jgi:hypothetical protein